MIPATEVIQEQSCFNLTCFLKNSFPENELPVNLACFSSSALQCALPPLPSFFVQRSLGGAAELVEDSTSAIQAGNYRDVKFLPQTPTEGSTEGF